MKRLAVISIAVSIVVLAVLIGQRWLQIDACLDNGGRWDYELNHCEGEKGG